MARTMGEEIMVAAPSIAAFVRAQFQLRHKDRPWLTCSQGPAWNTPVEAKMANGRTCKALFRSVTLQWEDLDGERLKPLATHWRALKTQPKAGL